MERIESKDFNQRIFIAEESGFSPKGMYEFNLDLFCCVWCCIKPIRATRWFGSDSYKNMSRPSHHVYIKKNPQLIITSNAWLVFNPLLSDVKYYKVIEIAELEKRVIDLQCSMYTSGEFISDKSNRNDEVYGDMSLSGTL